jgi:hypothetical protein
MPDKESYRGKDEEDLAGRRFSKRIPVAHFPHVQFNPWQFSHSFPSNPRMEVCDALRRSDSFPKQLLCGNRHEEVGKQIQPLGGETQTIENHGFYHSRMREISRTLLGKCLIYDFSDVQRTIKNTCDNPKVTYQVRFNIHIHATSLRESLGCYY